MLDPAAELVEAEVRGDAEALAGRFAQEQGRGPGGLATEGAGPTPAALARSQVEVLLVADDPDDERTAWFGAAPQQPSTDRDAVEAMGAPMPVEGRLADVAVRATLGTAAGVHVLDPGGAGPRDGLGALLRFADQGGGTATDAQAQGDQPTPGYREVLLDPTETYVCLRCGALVKQDSTDLHDRFHVSVEHPATRHAGDTRSH